MPAGGQYPQDLAGSSGNAAWTGWTVMAEPYLLHATAFRAVAHKMADNARIGRANVEPP